MKKIALSCAGALLLNWAAIESAQAYYIEFGVTAPSTIQTGQNLAGTFYYKLDLTSPPTGVISDTEVVSGNLSLGVGSLPLGFSITSDAGGSNTTSVPFSVRFATPGTYQLGAGSLSIRDFICSPCTSSGPRSLAVTPSAVKVTKSAAFTAAHLNAAAYSNALGETVSTLSSAANLTDLNGALLDIGTKGFDATKTNWGKEIAIALGLVLGGVAGGPAGLAIATTVALATAYTDVAAAVNTKIAKDPPDSNYLQIYQKGTTPLIGLDSLDPNSKAFLQLEADLIEVTLDDQQGILTSVEREQGAELAGNQAALLAQSLAAAQFAADYDQDSAKLQHMFGLVPGFLSDQNFEKIDPNAVSISNNLYASLSRSLTSGVPEPATWIELILGFGAVGGALRRRRRVISV